MGHEIDGNRAIYAKRPAWHRIGHVKESGWFTAEEALAVLNPDKEPIRKVSAFAGFINDKGEMQFVESPGDAAIMRINPDTKQPQVLSFMKKDYGVVQIEDQFAFLDDVVAEFRKSDDTAGAVYETAGLLRNGRQIFVVVDIGALTLDEKGRNDKQHRYLFASNSWDGSWAFRVKKTNYRVECANIAAMALRGSSDQVVSGDWSTRHTSNVLRRVEEAKAVLGMSATYDTMFAAQAEMMIQTPLLDDTLERLLVDLYTVDNEKTGQKEVDKEAVADVQTLYELSPTCANIHGTVWGGLQALIEREDWRVKVRGGKSNSVNEARLRRQMGETDKGFKNAAWERFVDWSVENPRPKLVSV